MELPAIEVRRQQRLRSAAAKAGAMQGGTRRRQFGKRFFAVVGRVFREQVVAEHSAAKQQRNHCQERVLAAEYRFREPSGPFAETSRGRPPAHRPRWRDSGLFPLPRTQRRGRNAEGQERQQQTVHLPSEQQRRAHLEQQLREARLRRVAGVREPHHAVEHQQQGEQHGAAFAGDGVCVAERVARGKRQQRGTARHPAIAGDARQREIREHRRRGEQAEHEHSRREDARRHVVAERPDGQLDQHEHADGPAVVGVVNQPAVLASAHANKPERLGEEALRQGQVLHRDPVVNPRPVEVLPVAAEHEHRGQAEQQNQQRPPSVASAPKRFGGAHGAPPKGRRCGWNRPSQSSRKP